jgi:hypothetical protein
MKLEICEKLCGYWRRWAWSRVITSLNVQLRGHECLTRLGVLGGIVCAIPLEPGGALGSSYGGAYAVKLASSA